MKHTQRTFRPPGMAIPVGVFLLILVFGGGILCAQQQFWEGRITTAPYGLLPNSGLYAASNAFPMDTKVVITNPEDGSKLEVRVVARLDQDRVFMQVSTDTADKLGLENNEILTARISPVESENGVLERQLAAERPYSSDPDINPSAGVEEERLSLIEEYLAVEAESGSVPEAEDRAPVQVAEDRPQVESELDEATPVEETPSGDVAAAEPILRAVESMPEQILPEEEISIALPPPERFESRDETEVTELPETSEGTEGDVSTASEATPDLPKVGFLEPIFLREKDRSYSPSAPALPETVARTEGPRASLEMMIPAGADDSDIYTVRHIPEPQGREAPSTDLRVAEIDREASEEISPAHEPEKLRTASAKPDIPETDTPILESGDTETPVEIPEDAELVLVPAEERPPEKPEDVEASEVEQPSIELVRKDKAEEGRIRGSYPVKKELEKSSYYLQVAAYGNIEPAQERAATLAVHYPVTIYAGEGPHTGPYRLMIGPLNEDESGTLLYTFTSRGYPDAFIRRGN